jgi:hypothetical protein
VADNAIRYFFGGDAGKISGLADARDKNMSFTAAPGSGSGVLVSFEGLR